MIDAVSRFAEALDTAIYDRSLETSNRTIHYFFDASVVVPITLGLDDIDAFISARSDREQVVCALLSAGYLGSVRMLPAHALELDQQLRLAPSYTGKHEVGDFMRRQQEFLDRQEVEQTLQTFREIIDEDVSDEVRYANYVRVLEELAPRAFVAIEAAAGNWRQRLRRYVDQGSLVFDTDESATARLFQSEAMWTIEKLISTQRQGERFSLRNVRDAIDAWVDAAKSMGRDIPDDVQDVEICVV